MQGCEILRVFRRLFKVVWALGCRVGGWRGRLLGKGLLGVVSGTALERILVARLQDGDPGGHYRRALSAFPDRLLAAHIQERWLNVEHLEAAPTYPALPMHSHQTPVHLQQLTVVAAFCEVWLAKQGHQNGIGVNLLTKIEPPTLPTLYGALLAGVDVVIMGAGIPREVPRYLHDLTQHQPTRQVLTLADGNQETVEFRSTTVVRIQLGSSS